MSQAVAPRRGQAGPAQAGGHAAHAAVSALQRQDERPQGGEQLKSVRNVEKIPFLTSNIRECFWIQLDATRTMKKHFDILIVLVITFVKK